MAPVMMLGALSWMDIESLTGDSLLMRGHMREDPPSEWPVEATRVPSRLVILMASSARSRIVQLLVPFHQPPLSISQQSVAELVGIELGAGVGDDVVAAFLVSVDGATES